jgi:hypothetical protein
MSGLRQGVTHFAHPIRWQGASHSMSQKIQPGNVGSEGKSRSPAFVTTWIALVTVMLFTLTIPAIDVALVCLVLGPHAYFQDGICIAHGGRPSRFTTGELVPSLPISILWLGGFLLTALVALLLLHAMVALFKKVFGKKTSA